MVKRLRYPDKTLPSSGLARIGLRGWLVLASVAVMMMSGGAGCRDSCAVREAPPDRTCTMKLKWWGRAITDYRQEQGKLPENVSGPEGHLHSWRVLVAPYYLAYEEFPDEIDYRFGEPWNSPHNRHAILRLGLPHSLGCPLESKNSACPYVSYFMLVRPASSEPDERSDSSSSLPGDAVLLVESAGCGVEFAEPKDLDWGDLWKGDSPFGPGKLHSLHPDVVKAVRVDGKVIDIPKTLGKDELRKLLSGSAD